MPQALRLQPAHEAAVMAYLERSPYEHAFLAWLFREPSLASMKSVIYVSFGEHDRVDGVAFFGRQIVLAADGENAIESFASIARRYRHERMIVAPRRTLERYWEHVRSWHAEPRLYRRRQPLLALDRQHVRVPSAPRITVRRARGNEWRIVAEESSAMIEQELETRARSTFPEEFDANVRRSIERGDWWVGERDGRVCFFCCCGPRSAHTVQLQGVWTPPFARGLGFATESLATIAQALLEDVPSLSLYVNDFNEKALALYSRVGFFQVGELATLLF